MSLQMKMRDTYLPATRSILLSSVHCTSRFRASVQGDHLVSRITEWTWESAWKINRSIENWYLAFLDYFWFGIRAITWHAMNIACHISTPNIMWTLNLSLLTPMSLMQAKLDQPLSGALYSLNFRLDGSYKNDRFSLCLYLGKLSKGKDIKRHQVFNTQIWVGETKQRRYRLWEWKKDIIKIINLRTSGLGIECNTNLLKKLYKAYISHVLNRGSTAGHIMRNSEKWLIYRKTEWKWLKWRPYGIENLQRPCINFTKFWFQ